MARGTVWLLAISTGCIIGNVYYAQPLLADIARDFGLSVSGVGAVAMITWIGTGVGMLLFVPLGDKFERRMLVWSMLVAESIALALAATARSVTWLSLACFAIGTMTATIHVIVPFAAQLAAPHERGRVVGTVLGGLLVGILVARAFSGVFGAQFGWRAVYWTASALMLALAAVLRMTLPPGRPASSIKWAELMRSIVALARAHQPVRQAALLAGLLFFTFTALWTTLVFLLRTPPYHYGTTAAGTFGLVGASGAAAAPLVGRFSDRQGPERAILMAIVATLAGYVVLLAFGRALAGLVAALVLIDIGVQSGHVANQSRIYGLFPEARSRVNTLYMSGFMLGGALGSYFGPVGFTAGGWTGFCAVPLAVLIGTLVYFMRAERNRSSADARMTRRRRSG